MIKHFMSSQEVLLGVEQSLDEPLPRLWPSPHILRPHFTKLFFRSNFIEKKKPFKVYWNLLESEAKAEEKLLCHRSMGGLKCTNYISFYVCHEFCFLILQLIKLLRFLSHWFFNLVPVLCAFVRAWCRQEVNLSRDMKPVKSEFRFYAFA